MYQLYVVLIVSAACYGVHGHHNDTCEEEERTVKDCMRKFFESRRATAAPVSNITAPDEDVEKCFSSSGCQKPLFQGQQIDADMDRARLCKQQLRQKKHTAMNDCVRKKAPDHAVPEDDDRWTARDKDENEKRIHYQRWALAKQTYDTTICPVVSNGEKVRNCLRDLWKRSMLEEGEQRHKEVCNAKAECMKEHTIEILCQEHMNITRSVKCECAQELLHTIKQQFYDCIGIAAPVNEDHHEHFWELHYCKDMCKE